MNINFTPEAEADLQSIHDYIAEHNSETAKRVIARVLQAIAILENFPLLGRPGRVDTTREYSITGLPYFAVYRLSNETEIDIIAIIHERRMYP